jgi:hypothetical protein
VTSRCTAHVSAVSSISSEKAHHVEETEMQSYYTATVVNQIIDDRVDTASRSRQTPRRRRLFARGARRDAPVTAASGRLRVSGAGR